MSLFYNDTVRVLRPPTSTNRAGETVLDYANLPAPEDGVARDNVHVRGTAQGEIVAPGQATAVSEWRVATEPGSGDWDVLSTDLVQLPDGQVVRVIGEPARPSDPLGGGLHHVEVLLRKAAG